MNCQLSSVMFVLSCNHFRTANAALLAGITEGN